MIAEPLRPLARPITEFRLLDGNPRRGDVESVKRSLKRFGQRKPIVVRDDGTVEAGNTTLKAAFGDDDATAKAFALADNRTSELGSFDLAALAAMAVDVQAADPGLLEAASYSEADLNALLAGQRVPEKRTDPDAVPDAPAEPVTVLGDVWLLGPHRLLCGDATSPDDLKRVTDGLGSVGIIYTDPPYGVDIVSSAGKVGAAVGYPFGGAKNGKQGSAGTVHTTAYLPVAGDGSTETAVDAFRLRASEHGKRVHPTQKPVALAQWAFGVIDPKAERATVLDAFAGSGSTLIAAHATWRRAALIEMEPAYADIICRRYQEHAGTKPVLESTGQPHDFTA